MYVYTTIYTETVLYPSSSPAAGVLERGQGVGRKVVLILQ